MWIGTFTPDPSLARHVQCFTVLELDDPASFGSPERILPDGIVEIVFHYGAPFAMRYAGESFRVQPTSLAVSQTRRFVEIRPTGRSGFVSARLFPWGACHLFDLPVEEFADRSIPAQELWGEDAARLEERLVLVNSPRERVRALQSFLIGKLREDRNGALEGWVGAIRNRRGNVAVSGLCAELGVGERSLERGFRKGLGMTPKQFARLTRFLEACRALRNGGWTNLAELALACGYADQAHFNRNIKDFSGLAPRQFLAENQISFLGSD
jgi:AraC-like DNA-binding protein